ncbi:MAG: hypothetical protein PHR84_00790 [Candidatus Omnitrophica bacterium]|jgi:Flp pilus assembly pilin Flp|nr:hypothetical protein [Candidatus Omnitrophota bacterium]MDD5661448.1 hypothetical protein [Candidatus Omnitrophota bacterium]
MTLRRGQNLIDLALLIGLVGLVVIGMEVYVRRGVQGKIKDVTDYITETTRQAVEDPKMVSSTTLNLDSSMEYKELTKGARSLKGREDSVSVYNQRSE